MGNGKLNHSRYLDYFAKDAANQEYWKAKKAPTSKQIAFYNKLYAICKENNIETKTDRYTKTRVDYAYNISVLIERLKEAGVKIKTKEKNAGFAVHIGHDRRGRYYTRESIEITPEISAESIEVYPCDMCGDKIDKNKIVWITSDYRICQACYYRLSPEDRVRLEKRKKQDKEIK